MYDNQLLSLKEARHDYHKCNREEKEWKRRARNKKKDVEEHTQRRKMEIYNKR